MFLKGRRAFRCADSQISVFIYGNAEQFGCRKIYINEINDLRLPETLNGALFSISLLRFERRHSCDIQRKTIELFSVLSC